MYSAACVHVLCYRLVHAHSLFVQVYDMDVEVYDMDVVPHTKVFTKHGLYQRHLLPNLLLVYLF